MLFLLFIFHFQWTGSSECLRGNEDKIKCGLARKNFSVIMSIFLISSMVVLMTPGTISHSGDEVYSEWAFSTPTMDGMINAGEWDDATIVDWSSVSGNTLGVFMYVMNDNTHLYMAYDATEDTTSDPMDGCTFCFDTDHNGLETDQHDDQFHLGNPFGALHKEHLIYDGGLMTWIDSGPVPWTYPGLDGEMGYGSSPLSASAHRVYEIAIPLTLLTVSPGDTIGYASNGMMAPGVVDGFGFFDQWPTNIGGPHPMIQYGDIILDTPPSLISVRITPDLDEKYGLPGTDIDYPLNVKNKGTSGPDTFNLGYSSAPLGWALNFYDETGTVMITDTGSLDTGDSIDIVARVTVPPAASPGEWDVAEVNASSTIDPDVYDLADLNTTVAENILVVDDDAGLTSELWYTNSLDSLAYTYDVWNVSEKGSPDMNAFDSHIVVIWFTGNDAWGQTTFNNMDRQNLGAYLDNGGKLFISSSGLGQDAWQNFDDWYEEYFDVKHPNSFFGGTTVYSKPGNPVSNGMLPFDTHVGDYCADLNGGLNFLEPILMAQPSFNITNPGVNNTGITLDHYAYRSVYNAFDLADVNTNAARDDIMDRALNWLMPNNGVSIFPNQMNYGGPGTVVNHSLTVKNIGSMVDSFDLTSASLPFGWLVEFYDVTNTVLLIDNNGNPFPDTGDIDPYDTLDITVRVTINPLAIPGDIEISTITATSFLAPAEVQNVPLETQVFGDVLLVDDDKYINSEDWYISSLVNNGYSYNIWNRTSYGVPPLSLLQDHIATIWFTGNTDGNHWGNYKTLYPEDRDVLGDYMDSGGMFYLSSSQSGNDAYWSMEPWQSWYNEYLCADFIGGWGGQQAHLGQLNNPIGDSLNLDTHTVLGDYCQELSGFVNTFNVLAPGEPAFEMGAALGEYTGLCADTGTYRMVQTSFDFADVNISADRDILMWRILNWLCPVDGVSIYEDQEGFGYATDTIDYPLTVKNIGSNVDTIDLDFVAGFHGWLVEFYDETNTVPLVNTGGNPLLPDTGPVAPSDHVNITVRVTIGPAAAPGEQELNIITANSSNDPALGSSVELVTSVPYDAPWSDDMELFAAPGMADWDAEGLWHKVDAGDIVAPPWNISNSGDWSWWYGQDLTGDHDTGGQNTGMLASPPIDLTGTSFAGLGYEDWYDGDTWANILQVKISVDDGDWQSIENINTMATPLRVWTHHSVNLDAYTGSIVKIGFWFDLGQFGWGGMNAPNGWYIDDVVIDITPPAPPENTTAALSETSYLAQSDWSWSGPVTNDYTATHISDDFHENHGEWTSYLGRWTPQNEPVVTDGTLIGGTFTDTQTADSVYERWQEEDTGAGRFLDIYYNCTFPQPIYGIFDIQIRGGWYFDSGDPADFISIFAYNYTSGVFEDTGTDMSKDSMAYRYVNNLPASDFVDPATNEVLIRFYDDFQAIGEDIGTLYLDLVAIRAYTSYGYHTWQFVVYDGPELETYEFFVEASNSGNAENDGWLFEYSFDDIAYFPFPSNIEFLPSETSDVLKSSDIPIPGSGNVYIRATDTDRGYGNETQDYINIDFMEIIPSNAVTGVRFGDVNISWDSSPSPDVYSYNLYRAADIDGPYLQIAENILALYYIDVDAGDQDWNNYFYYVRAVDDTGNEDISASPSKAAKVVKTVSPGWNLISTPVDMVDETVATALQTGDWNNVRTYDSFDAADPWKGNNPLKPPILNDLASLDHTIGIWVNMTSADNLVVAGQVRSSTTINLKAGWNLVGYPTFNNSRTVADALMGVPYDMVDAYDGGAPYLINQILGTDIMSPSEAYWVRATADCIWVVDA